MDSKAQASFEYLLALLFSFFLTLIVFGAVFNAVGTAKQDLSCISGHCLPEKAQSAQKIIDDNVLYYVVTIVTVYFLEFFFVLFFLKYIAKPEKKKLAKHSKY